MAAISSFAGRQPQRSPDISEYILKLLEDTGIANPDTDYSRLGEIAIEKSLPGMYETTKETVGDIGKAARWMYDTPVVGQIAAGVEGLDKVKSALPEIVDVVSEQPGEVVDAITGGLKQSFYDRGAGGLAGLEDVFPVGMAMGMAGKVAKVPKLVQAMGKGVPKKIEGDTSSLTGTSFDPVKLVDDTGVGGVNPGDLERQRLTRNYEQKIVDAVGDRYGEGPELIQKLEATRDRLKAAEAEMADLINSAPPLKSFMSKDRVEWNSLPNKYDPSMTNEQYITRLNDEISELGLSKKSWEGKAEAEDGSYDPDDETIRYGASEIGAFETSEGFRRTGLQSDIKGLEKLDKEELDRLDRAVEQGFNIDAYHGTKGDITNFDPGLLGTTTGAPSARRGFFFAEQPETAEKYAYAARLDDLNPEYADQLTRAYITVADQYKDAADDYADFLLEQFGEPSDPFSKKFRGEGISGTPEITYTGTARRPPDWGTEREGHNSYGVIADPAIDIGFRQTANPAWIDTGVPIFYKDFKDALDDVFDAVFKTNPNLEFNVQGLSALIPQIAGRHKLNKKLAETKINPNLDHKYHSKDQNSDYKWSAYDQGRLKGLSERGPVMEALSGEHISNGFDIIRNQVEGGVISEDMLQAAYDFYKKKEKLKESVIAVARKSDGIIDPDFIPHADRDEGIQLYDGFNDKQIGATIIPARIRLEDPFIYDFGGDPIRITSYDELLKEAAYKGHDGAIFKGTADGGGIESIYVVFEPNQIRSRFAQFDPTQSVSGDLVKSFAPIAVPIGVGAAAESFMANNEENK